MRSPALQAGSGLVPRTPPRGCGFEGGSCGSYTRPRPPLGFLRPGRGEFLPRGVQQSGPSSARVYCTHGAKPCSAWELALGIIQPWVVGACRQHPKYAGTAFCPVACSTERRTRDKPIARRLVAKTKLCPGECPWRTG